MSENSQVLREKIKEEEDEEEKEEEEDDDDDDDDEKFKINLRTHFMRMLIYLRLFSFTK